MLVPLIEEDDEYDENNAESGEKGFQVDTAKGDDDDDDHSGDSPEDDNTINAGACIGTGESLNNDSNKKPEEEKQ